MRLGESCSDNGDALLVMMGLVDLHTHFLSSLSVALQPIAYSLSWMVVNVVLCVLSWWRRFANNYLHWGALGTWLVLNIQGKLVFPPALPNYRTPIIAFISSRTSNFPTHTDKEIPARVIVRIIT